MNRKVISKNALLLAMTLTLGGASALPVFAEEDLPSRDIAVVYDDSGSMYQNFAANTQVDTWSQAKYAMEVFAAMLNPDDTMDIYYMSDYSKNGSKSGPRITLDGSTAAKKNIKEIHDETTASADTPFETVEAAYEGLEDSDADEKWLVILTDGEFRTNDDTAETREKTQAAMDVFYANKDPDVNVIFLAMGPEAIPIEENRDENLYMEKADDSSQILEKLTDVSHRIFNMNGLDVEAKSGTFKLDVPSSSLMVFVQGDGARIEDLVDENGKSIGDKQPSVTVSATQKSDNTEHPDNIPATGLNGEVAVFEGDFAPGTYKVVAKNARTINVYFKPNLDVVAYLTTENGERIDDLSDLPTGDYSIHFELVSGLDHKPLEQDNSVLQSEYGVEYEAQIKNNGQLLDSVYKDGDTIHVDQGNLDIDVLATYLKYNHSSTHLNYDIWSEKDVEFTFDKDNPGWTLNSGRMDDSSPLRVKMTVEGNAPSETQWAALNVPAISVSADNNAELTAPIIEKDTEPGTFLITPNPGQIEFTKTDYSKANPVIHLSMDQDVDNIPWKGTGETQLKIDDKRPIWQKDSNWVMHLLGPILGILLLLILLLGYVPGIKKYLPKMEKQPKIDCDPKNPVADDAKTESGSVVVDTASTLIPYKSQTATIRYVPQAEASRYPKMKVRAKESGRRMELLNATALKSKHVSINSRSIEDLLTPKTAAAPKAKDAAKKKKDKKKKDTGILFPASAPITTDATDYTYVCRLTQKARKGGSRR